MIYFLARNIYPFQDGGGSLIRYGQVTSLIKNGWNVKIVIPDYKGSNIKNDDKYITIPFKHIQKVSSLLERVGYYEDYLDSWIKDAFTYLKNEIKSEDIIFATSGGELGMIKLGSLLKDELLCKFIANFHDPINYGYMNGLRRDKKFHIGREKAHEKYMKNTDLIITSSNTYSEILKKKYKYLENRIYNNYFGYIKKIDINKYKKIKSNKLRIAYAGIMSNTQKPEILYNIFNLLSRNDIELYFIGNSKDYKALNKIENINVKFIDYLPHEDFLKFMIENIDIGFVSLINDYYGACIPSKIYEYINLGIPILGALPNGDALDIININKYGIACHYKDKSSLENAMIKFLDNEYLELIKSNILKDREEWFITNKFSYTNYLIKELVL